MKHQATQLYRHYGADGELQYIGISLSAPQRLVQHRGRAHWFDQIVRVEMQSFATRHEAAAAEKAAIEREAPKYNIQFSKEQAKDRALARAYQKGYREVMEELNPVVQNVKRDKQAIETAFWQWRDKRRRA
jgi:hypothetical protein